MPKPKKKSLIKESKKIDENQKKVKNILVTGGLGILGAKLVKILNKKNSFNIFILDRSKNNKKIKILELNKLKSVKIIKGNFNDYKTVFKIIKNKNINTIFHLGAITQVIDAYKSPMETFNSNIVGTINILESIRNLKSICVLASIR